MAGDPTDRAAEVEDLFHRALERPVEERTRFLAAECAGDPELEREIASLLVAQAMRSSALDRSPAAAFVDLAAAPRLIGPFALERELGHGGMGAVFLARRVDGGFAQTVAIKLIDPARLAPGGATRDEFIRRFLEERRVLAALDHPHIARLIDGGATPEGTPWLAMEFIDGKPIDRYCREQALPLRRTLELFRQVCLAVHFAHGKLIAHRDLKPGNVLVTDAPQPGGAPIPKLLDFGIAKLLGPPDATVVAAAADDVAGTGNAEPRPSMTGTLFLGTPSYASPEQFRGDPATTLTDVYSLGVILFQLLTGALPHDLAGLSPHEIARTVCTEPPRRPSRFDRRLRGDLDTIVRKAIETDPAQRYSSAAALADDLERHLTDHPIHARPHGAAHRVWKTVRRHKVPFAILAAAVIALAASSIWIYVLYLRALDSEASAETRRWEAEQARDETDRRRAQAEETAKLFVEIFGQPDPFMKTGPRVTVVEALESALPRLATELAGQPELLASIRRMAGSTLTSLDRLETAQRELEAACATLLEVRGEGDRETILALHDLAVLHVDAGRPGAAEAAYRRVLELLERHPQRESTRDAESNSLAGLGIALSFQGRLHEAEATLLRATEMCRERLGSRNPQVAMSLQHLAAVHEELGDLARTERELAEAAAINAASIGADHGRTLTVQTRRARVLLLLERDGEAQRLLEEALPAIDRVFGPDHGLALYARQNLAKALHNQGRRVEGRALAAQCVERARAAHGDEGDVTLETMNTLTQILWGQGDHEAAGALQEELVAIRRRTLGDDHLTTLIERCNLGVSWHELKRDEDAEALFADVIELALEVGVTPDLPLVLDSRHFRALSLQRLGRDDEAEAELVAAWDALREDHDLAEMRPQRVLGALADFHAKAGNAARAEEFRALQRAHARPPPVR